MTFFLAAQRGHKEPWTAETEREESETNISVLVSYVIRDQL